MSDFILSHKEVEWAYDQWCNGHTKLQIAIALNVCEKTISRALRGRPRIRPLLIYGEERKDMGIQYAEAPEGTEYAPTYKGRFLKGRYEQEPQLKRKVSKRWLSEGYVELKKITGEEHENQIEINV